MKFHVLGLALLCTLASLVVGSRLRRNEVEVVNGVPEQILFDDPVYVLEKILGVVTNVTHGVPVKGLEDYLRSIQVEDKYINRVKRISEEAARDVILLRDHLEKYKYEYRHYAEYYVASLFKDQGHLIEQLPQVNKDGKAVISLVGRELRDYFPRLDEFLLFVTDHIPGLDILPHDEEEVDPTTDDPVYSIESILGVTNATRGVPVKGLEDYLRSIQVKEEHVERVKHISEEAARDSILLLDHLERYQYKYYNTLHFIKDFVKSLFNQQGHLIEHLDQINKDGKKVVTFLNEHAFQEFHPRLREFLSFVSDHIPGLDILPRDEDVGFKIDNDLIQRLKTDQQSLIAPISKLIQEHRLKRVDADRISNNLIHLLSKTYEYLEASTGGMSYSAELRLAQEYMSNFLHGLINLKSDSNFDKELKKVFDDLHKLIQHLKELNLKSEVKELYKLKNELKKLKPDSLLPKRPKVQVYDYLTPVDNFRDDPTYYVPTLAEFLRQQGHRNAITLSNELFDVLYSLLGKLDGSKLSSNDLENAYAHLGSVLKVLSLYPEYLDKHYEELFPHLDELLLSVEEFDQAKNEVLDLSNLKKELLVTPVDPDVSAKRAGKKTGKKVKKGAKASKKARALRKRRN